MKQKNYQSNKNKNSIINILKYLKVIMRDYMLAAVILNMQVYICLHRSKSTTY